MKKILLDAELTKKLNGLAESIELCDPNGQTMWRVLPESEYQSILHQVYQFAEAQRPFLSQEEVLKRRQANGNVSLADILQSWKL